MSEAALKALEEVESLLISANEYWNGSQTDGAMSDALCWIETKVAQSLALVFTLRAALSPASGDGALENQIPAQDCEIEYWLQQAENYAEVQIPADDLRAIIARICGAALSPVGDKGEKVTKPFMGQIMAECDCQHVACEMRGYCMASKITSLEAELAAERAKGERMREALFEIIGLDHHNMGPEGQATKLARAALEGGA